MNLIEAIQARCNELRNEFIPAYQEIGNSGAFAIALMRASIAKAEKAIAEMDTVGMVVALQDLREFKL